MHLHCLSKKFKELLNTEFYKEYLTLKELC